MRHRALSALVLGLTLPLALGACGSDDEASPLAQASSDAAATTTASPTDAPSATASTDPEPAGDKADDQGHETFAGTLQVANAQQQAVADAWIAYWRLRVNAYGEAEVDPTALGEVASGTAASDVVGYVDYLQKNDLRTQGDILMGVSKVKITGDIAGLQGCMVSRAVDVDADGQPVEDLTRFVNYTGVFDRQGDTWILSNAIKTGERKCSAR